MIDNSTDNSCVVSDNSNSSSVKSCKNVNSVTIGNASSSYGNNSSTISNIACNTIPGDNVPTNVNDKMDVSNVNDNMGNLNNDNDSTITWDDVVAMEDSASYTWTRRNGSLSSRIDFFIVAYVWVPSVSFCDIVACPFSDHCAVVMSVHVPEVWKLNLSVLDDFDYVSLISNFWFHWRAMQPRFSTMAKW